MHNIIRMLPYVIRRHTKHPNDLRCCPMSSGWQNEIWTPSHRDDWAIDSISSGWLMMLSYLIRMRWLIWYLSHPDDLAILGILSGWFMDITGCHPDDLWCCPMSPGWDNQNLTPKSPGWLSYSQCLIRMTYDRCIVSSGCLTGVGISSGWVTAN